MALDRGPGRSVAILASVLCLLALGAAFVSLGFAQTIDSPSYYDGDDDAGIQENRFAPEPPLERSVLEHGWDLLPPARWRGRPALDHPEHSRDSAYHRSVPRGPPA